MWDMEKTNKQTNKKKQFDNWFKQSPKIQKKYHKEDSEEGKEIHKV